MPLIEDHVDNNPSFLKALAGFASSVHSPGLALKKLGLDHHPSAVRIQGYRDPLIAKIIYHCDPQTLYRPAPAWDDLAPPKPPNPSMLQDLQDASASGSGLGSSRQPEHPALPNTSSASSSGNLAVPDMQASGSASSVAAMVPANSESASASAAANAQPVLDALARLEEAGTEASANNVAAAFEGAMGDIFKSHILRSFAAMLGDNEDKQPSSLEGNVLSVRLGLAGIESLTFLSDDVSGLQNQSAQEVGAAIAALSRGGWTFFQLVRKGVSEVVTPLNLRQVFKKSDWAIQPMAILDGDKKSQTMTVTPAENISNLVLSLEALPLETLLRLYKWETSNELQCLLQGVSLPPLPSHPDALSKVLPLLLEDLLAEGGFFLQGGEPHFKAKSSLLECMQSQDLVQLGQDGAWLLTGKGKSSVKIGNVLRKYKRVVQPRAIAFSEMETVELMLTLRTQGFRHESVHPKRCSPDPYVHGEGAKIWYHDASKDTISREYLLLLATSEEHKLAVPHLQLQRVYDQMLGKESRPPVKRSGGNMDFLETDELWVDESALVPLKKTRKAKAKAQAAIDCAHHNQDALLDSFPEELEPLGEAGSTEQLAGSGSQQPHVETEGAGSTEQRPDDAAQAQASVFERDFGHTTPSSSESSSESGSGSQSSSSSSSSSSSTSAGAEDARVIRRRKGGKRNMSTSTKWGLCRLTPTKTGWQITCGHPKHNPASATAHCTKTRSSAISGEADALRLLKTWAVWGSTASSKADHQNVWKQVLRAAKNNELPSMEHLDSNPPQAYPD